MNERIRELLNKHIAPPALAVTRDLENQHTAHVTYTVSQAEMNTLLSAVIQECVRHFNEDYQRDFDTNWREDLSKSINKHFGVEPC